jgi:hypothetical protein
MALYIYSRNLKLSLIGQFRVKCNNVKTGHLLLVVVI